MKYQETVSDRLFAFYGDDFTGSTDALEYLVRGGVKSVLFVNSPTGEMLARFPDARAIGIAGSSRVMSPIEMDQHLPTVFETLKKLQTRFVHYKICSTFDSSPTVGSIGRAIEIGRRVFDSAFVPLLVGAPMLGRYCAFGNLFARSGLDTAPFRLDRHPTMQHHPVTPMSEADLRLHLQTQTSAPIDLFDICSLDDPEVDSLFQKRIENGNVILIDAVSEAHIRTIGRLLDSSRRQNQCLFAVGSSAIELAVTRHWQDQGITESNDTAEELQNRGPIAVVSGSCSPVTARQIDYALQHGFAEIPLDVAALLDDDRHRAEIRRAIDMAAVEVGQGHSVIAHIARGSDDNRIKVSNPESAAVLGKSLGEILYGLLQRVPLERAATTGGDTSGHIARQLGIEALEIVGPIAPGSPLCRAHSSDPRVNGLEITFKGGQVGHADFFQSVVAGGPRQQVNQ
jgi:uncharacterized protein YgbK (DUF1537 family)